MLPRSGIIYYYDWVPHHPTPKEKPKTKSSTHASILGLMLFFISLGGLSSPYVYRLYLETNYKTLEVKKHIRTNLGYTPPARIEQVFNPLLAPDGASISPASTQFGLVIPKIGVNAPIIAHVDPSREADYQEALKTGIAHSALSYLPDAGGTVYLFSHSTNYEWFVDDLNAAFYLLKNLEQGDLATIIYQEKYYTYKIMEKRIVSPKAVSYLVPEANSNMLILETCWPPGSVTERLLLFAELVKPTTNVL